MSKMFTVAGTSTYRGENTFRFANSTIAERTKVLLRNGHADIKLVLLPNPMTKEEAIAYLQSTEGMQGVMPKTGRGSGLTQDQIDAQNKLVAEKRAEEDAAATETAANDEDFFSKL